MSSSKQIKFGAILSYISIAINIIAGLVFTPWMIEIIGKSSYGIYTLANSLISLFLMDFGLSSATAKYLSKYNADGDQDGANRFLGAIYKLYLIIDTVIVVILFIIFLQLEKIYINLTPKELEQLKVVYIISAVFSVVNFPFVTFNGILTAYEKFIPLKILGIAYRIFSVGFTVIALLLGGRLYALVIVHVVVSLLILVAKYYVIKKSTPIKANFQEKSKSIYSDIFSFSIWVTISMLAQRLIFNITPSILGAVANTTSIAVFGIIITIEGYAYTITTAIDGIFMPRITRIYSTDNADKNIQPLYLNVGRFQFCLNGLIFVGFAVIGKQFIQLWVGSDYMDAYYGLLLVLAPGLFYNSMQIVNTTILVQNKVNLQAAVNVLAGIINVVLSIPLSRSYGVVGASLSICIAYSFRVIALNIIAWKAMKFDVPCFLRDCYLRLSVPVVCTVILGVLLNRMIAGADWIALVIKGVLVAMAYLLFVLMIGIGKTERIKLANKITQIIKK